MGGWGKAGRISGQVFVCVGGGAEGVRIEITVFVVAGDESIEATREEYLCAGVHGMVATAAGCSAGGGGCVFFGGIVAGLYVFKVKVSHGKISCSI